MTIFKINKIKLSTIYHQIKSKNAQYKTIKLYILKSVFKIPPPPVYNVANVQHSLSHVLVIVSQHC